MKARFLLIGLIILGLASGCTIIRYVDPPEENNGTDGPPVGAVDILVLVDMERRSTANIAPAYAQMFATFEAGLELQRVEVRKVALAPLTQRVEGGVPLLYGRDDPESQFSHLGEALLYYTRDEGHSFLSEGVASEAENLALLGMELAQKPVHQPGMAQSGAAYFSEPADGFVVLTLSSRERSCEYSAQDCQLNGMSAAQYFTRAEGADAEWITFPGGGKLPVSRIFHAAIATMEGRTHQEFSEECQRHPNFPASYIDVMEPSDKHFFQPFISELESRGANASNIDMCMAMSQHMEREMGTLALQVRQMLAR